MRYTTLFLTAVFLMGSSTDAGAEDKEEHAVIRSSLSKDGKPTACLGACTVNFRRELKVPFDYLDSLGSRIHEARKIPDPVELAAAATSLSVAETVAGKSASVSSAAVMKEAIELAKLRGSAPELKAVALLVSDKKTKNELSELAELSADSEGEVGEASKALFGNLQVENHTVHDLKIFMDGKHLGWVNSGQTYSFHVHNHNRHNHFDAYCSDDGDLIRHADYEGHAHFLNWHIDE